MRPVLLVDDDPDDALLVGRAFIRHHLHHPLQVATGVEEALAWLRRGGNPIFILLDLHLPRIPGIALLRTIRADPALRHLRVIAFTSECSPQQVAEAWQAGASSFLRKPLDGERFMQAIAQVGTYWTAVNEPPPTVEV